MRPLRYGDGTLYGDPNAYWGSPSYVLAPGDANYIIPAPPRGQNSHLNPKYHEQQRHKARPAR